MSMIPTQSTDTLFIEIRGIYDGWSVKQLPDGTLVNRWPVGDCRYQPTQDWINQQGQSYTSNVEDLPWPRQ